MRGAILGAMFALATSTAFAQAPEERRPDQTAFVELYRELVDTDTSLTTGSCTLAAERMLARLRAAGFAPGDADIFVPPGHSREGGLIARIAGSDPDAPAMLLVDHLDVVEARREDWGGRDPYRLVEEDGWFIGRGVIDDKALSAIWVDSLIRLRAEGFRPRRTIKVALTCGEESGDGVNGVVWLLENQRDALEAGFALNEGGHGRLDDDGQPLALLLAVGEKHSANFTLEARNPGGHSSRPRPDNAIYDLATALLRVRDIAFPVAVDATGRTHLERMSPLVRGEMGRAMARLAADPDDAEAAAIVTGDVIYNAMLRTTCVATVAEAGGAVNALPQRARATIQCRLLPGDSVAAVQQRLAQAISGLDVTLTAPATTGVVAVAPPLDDALLAAMDAEAETFFPGVPVVPNLLTAGTDGRYLSAAGIPTYGVPGIMLGAGDSGAHGVNERIPVRSVLDGRDYLHALIQRLSLLGARAGAER